MARKLWRWYLRARAWDWQPLASRSAMRVGLRRWDAMFTKPDREVAACAPEQ